MATDTRPTDGQASTGSAAAARAALDVMLTDAAIGRGRTGRFLDPLSAAKLAGALARRPLALARRV